MADEIAMVEEKVEAWRRRHPVLRFVAIGLLSLLLLCSAAIWMLDSGPGHRLIIDRIGALRPSSGLRIRIGRIDGSIWNRATLRDLRLYDNQGLFLEAPEIALDWRPAAWVANKLWIRSVETDLLILHRKPKLQPSPKKGPLLPGFDIHVGRLRIAKLRLEPPVAGRRHIVRIAAEADIHDGRVLLKLDGASSARDRLTLQLDRNPTGTASISTRGWSGPPTGLSPGRRDGRGRSTASSRARAAGPPGRAGRRWTSATFGWSTCGWPPITANMHWTARSHRAVCYRASCSACPIRRSGSAVRRRWPTGNSAARCRSRRPRWRSALRARSTWPLRPSMRWSLMRSCCVPRRCSPT
ncbi:hypothetical protein ACFSTI_27580 [Rhizorhabdus histidinilytica]